MLPDCPGLHRSSIISYAALAGVLLARRDAQRLLAERALLVRTGSVWRMQRPMPCAGFSAQDVAGLPVFLVNYVLEVLLDSLESRLAKLFRARKKESEQQHMVESPESTPEESAKASPPPARGGTGRSAAEIAKIRRRAVLMALGILLLLLVFGLGESFGSFLPHKTLPFANGKTQAAGNVQVTLQFTPNPPKISGDPATQVEITLQGHAGQKIDGAQVHLNLSMVTMDMGASGYTAQGLGQGRYQAKVAFLMVGQWQVTVNITPPGGAAATTTFTVDVAA